MPADSSTASGWSARTRAARAASRSNAGAGSAPRGATAISPRSRSPARRRRPRRPAPGRRRGPPRRGRPARPPGPPRSTWTQDLDRPAGLLARPGRGRRPATARSTEWTTAPRRATAAALLRCSWPMKCQRSGRSASSAALPISSCARFSPKSRCPSAARARTSSAGQVLLTASSATDAGSRPAARAAASIRARTARRFSSSRPRADPARRAPARQPSQTRPAWRPVTPSRRWENRCGSSTVHRGSWTTSGTPALRERSRRARPAGPGPACPCRVGTAAAGATRATSACIARGHLVAGAAHRRPEQRGHVPRPRPQARHRRQRGRAGRPGGRPRARRARRRRRRRRGRPAGPARSRRPGRRARGPGVAVTSASVAGTGAVLRPVDDGDAGAVHLVHPDQPVLGHAELAGHPRRGWPRRRPGRPRRGRRG